MGWGLRPRTCLHALLDPTIFGVRRLLFACLLVSACSPGVGRPVVFPDAGEPKDEGVFDMPPPPVDMGVRDFGPSDIALFDRGMPPPAPFIGAYAILNSADLLFAREIDGQLQLTVTNFPYTYEGTFERSGATFARQHRTCGANGSFLESEIRGAFFEDFSADVSGVYQVDQRLDSDVFGCAPEVQGSFTWAINALGGGAANVFMARDIAPPHTYFGTLRNQRRVLGAVYRATAESNSREASLEGQFSQLTTNDELVFSGQRQVYLPDTDCQFAVTFTATRSASI